MFELSYFIYLQIFHIFKYLLIFIIIDIECVIISSPSTKITAQITIQYSNLIKMSQKQQEKQTNHNTQQSHKDHYIQQLQEQIIQLDEQLQGYKQRNQMLMSIIKESIKLGKIQKSVLDQNQYYGKYPNIKKQSENNKWDVAEFWGQSPPKVDQKIQQKQQGVINGNENKMKSAPQKNFMQLLEEDNDVNIINGPFKLTFDTPLYSEQQLSNKSKTQLPMKKTQSDLPFEEIKLDLRKSNVSRRSNSQNQRSFPLIQGCFIIQKKDIGNILAKNSLSEMIEYTYPQDLLKTQKQTLQMVVRYIFGNNFELSKIQDDQYDSRKNQIIYGTPYDDYSFVFQDHKWINKKQVPEIMRDMGTMKKKYVYLLVRPQLIGDNSTEEKQQKLQKLSKQAKKSQQGDQQQQQQQQNQPLYETQVIYGIISPFPFRVFFQDLHRTIQQQVKYAQFTPDNQLDQLSSRTSKYKIIGTIMKKLFDYKYSIRQFPIKHTYETGVSKIQLDIPSVQSLNVIQQDYLKQHLPKFNFAKIGKLLHYTLAERFIIVETKNRKLLNQLIEMVRIMIKPFLWIFAIVYNYSQYFQPFLSSPMPIIIGKTSSSQQLPQGIDLQDFDYIQMENKATNQLKDTQKFYKTLKKFKKYGQKYSQDKSKMIKKYVRNLKSFIEKGVLDQQLTDFHIQFMDTQMVSYYRDFSENTKN